MTLASLEIEFVEKRFDFGRRSPVLHENPIDDRVLLDGLLGLFNRGLFQINGEGNVTLRAIHSGAILKGLDVILGTFAAELVMAARPNGILRWFVTDATDKNIEARLHVLLEDEVWVVRHLSHLHDETENIGIIIQHDTATDVGIKLPTRVGHDTSREVMFDLAKELVVDSDSDIGVSFKSK